MCRLHHYLAEFYKDSIFSVLRGNYLLQVEQELVYKFVLVVYSEDFGFAG
jgi:hypothetical protein